MEPPGLLEAPVPGLIPGHAPDQLTLTRHERRENGIRLQEKAAKISQRADDLAERGFAVITIGISREDNPTRRRISAIFGKGEVLVYRYGIRNYYDPEEMVTDSLCFYDLRSARRDQPGKFVDVDFKILDDDTLWFLLAISEENIYFDRKFGDIFCSFRDRLQTPSHFLYSLRAHYGIREVTSVSQECATTLGARAEVSTYYTHDPDDKMNLPGDDLWLMSISVQKEDWAATTATVQVSRSELNLAITENKPIEKEIRASGDTPDAPPKAKLIAKVEGDRVIIRLEETTSKTGERVSTITSIPLHAVGLSDALLDKVTEYLDGIEKMVLASESRSLDGHRKANRLMS